MLFTLAADKIKHFIFRYRFLIISVALFFAVLSVMALLLYNGIIWFNNPSKVRYLIRGIDVSHHQGKINWAEVDNNKVHFVFMKATEGADHKDTRFQHNWIQARQAGLVRGAYHFFTFSKTGPEQARNFIDTVPNEPNTLPPVIDLELGGNSKIQPDPSTLMRELNAYIEMIENHYQRKPILYTTYEFYDYYLKNQNLPYSIWIRDIFWTPDISDNKAWLFWQYSNRGRIPGIRGFADMDVFNGSTEDFTKLLH